MNERRRFLQVVGGGAAALGVGCSGSVAHNGATGTGGSGAGGSGAGGNGAGGMTSSSSSSSSSSGAMCEKSPAGTKVGKPTDYAAMGLHIVTNMGTLIGRDAGGLYALNPVCPHQLCDMSASDFQGPFGQLTSGNQDIVCLCHGSKFGATGALLQGPAHTGLTAFPLALGCDGFLYVDENSSTPNSTRLKA